MSLGYVTWPVGFFGWTWMRKVPYLGHGENKLTLECKWMTVLSGEHHQFWRSLINFGQEKMSCFNKPKSAKWNQGSRLRFSAAIFQKVHFELLLKSEAENLSEKLKPGYSKVRLLIQPRFDFDFAVTILCNCPNFRPRKRQVKTKPSFPAGLLKK